MCVYNNGGFRQRAGGGTERWGKGGSSFWRWGVGGGLSLEEGEGSGGGGRGGDGIWVGVREGRGMRMHSVDHAYERLLPHPIAHLMNK